jgi:hypothetical protein
MYESPITKIDGESDEQVVKYQENQLMFTIQEEMEFSVDKEELIKALKYDRKQYEKGKIDGKAEMIERIEHAGPYTAGEIICAIENAQKKLEQYRLERPVIICHKEDEDIFKSYCPGANIIVMPEVPGKGLFIADKELRREINQWGEENED